METAVVVLAGLLIFREIASFIERKRLTGMLYSKSMSEFTYLDEKVEHKTEYTNPILEQRKRQERK